MYVRFHETYTFAVTFLIFKLLTNIYFNKSPFVNNDIFISCKKLSFFSDAPHDNRRSIIVDSVLFVCIGCRKIFGNKTKTKTFDVTFICTFVQRTYKDNHYNRNIGAKYRCKDTRVLF